MIYSLQRHYITRSHLQYPAKPSFPHYRKQKDFTAPVDLEDVLEFLKENGVEEKDFDMITLNTMDDGVLIVLYYPNKVAEEYMEKEIKSYKIKLNDFNREFVEEKDGAIQKLKELIRNSERQISRLSKVIQKNVGNLTTLRGAIYRIQKITSDIKTYETIIKEIENYSIKLNGSYK